MNLAHLQETRAAKITEMRAATGNPEQFDKLEAEVRALDKDIKRAVTLAEFERQADAAPDASLNKELRSYSIAKAFTEALNGSLTGLEREQHDELSKGRESRGVMIPTSVLLETRDQTVGTNTAGGYAVATQLGGLIDRLRPTLAVQGMGATVLSGLTGFLDLPKLTGGPTAYWVAEDGNTTESASTFGKISMGPKTVSGEMQLSRRLMLQNAVALESVLRADLGFVLAQALDKAAIAGTGTSNQPTGILTAITESATVSTAVSDIAADLIADLEVDDVMGTGAFLTNATLMGVVRKLKDLEGRNIPASEVFHGKPVTVTNQVAAIAGEHPLIYGHWSDLIIGYWSGVDVLLNPYHSDVASKGGVKLHAFLDADIAIRHNEAFAWKAI
ncbi:HK97 family phage major capsid protein [Ensifer sp. WSM1721]|uniref:phage major capsid protein n=1 Tax=Ensifer sp. WSM1721 TaxID=1041159 RepID=UPI000479ADFD|nr:phage major capsid protein [Ensifer sp. WSM1721]